MDKEKLKEIIGRVARIKPASLEEAELLTNQAIEELTNLMTTPQPEHKSIEGLKKEFEEKFVHKGDDNGNGAEDVNQWVWTIMGSYPSEVWTWIKSHLTNPQHDKELLCGNAGDNVYLTFRGGCREPLTLENSYRCTGCGGRFHKDCILKHFKLEKDHDWGRQQAEQDIKNKVCNLLTSDGGGIDEVYKWLGYRIDKDVPDELPHLNSRNLLERGKK